MIEVPDFEALYRERPDPWQVGSSFYEQRKLGVVLAALGRPRYRAGWDPACGTGHLAAGLAERCDTVLATDVAETAVRLAAVTCAESPNVTLRPWRFPVDGSPPSTGPFDLVVLSEFLYYLGDDERAEIGSLVDAATTADAELLAVHWRPEPHDAWLSGAAVQQELARTLTDRGWRSSYRFEDEEFVLAGWRRTDGAGGRQGGGGD